MEEKINALLANAEFATKVEQAEDLAAVAALFNAEGVEVTEEDIKAALEKVSSEELDESSLDGVAGGLATAMVVIGGLKIAKWLYDQLKNRYGDRWRSHLGGGNGFSGGGGSMGGR